MARSLITGLLAAGWNQARIRVSEPLAEQRKVLADMGVTAVASNDEAIVDAAVVVLAVKPQLLSKVLRDLRGLENAQLLISIAAGVPLTAIRQWSSPDQPVVRCMPNTPALLRAGITGLFADERVNAAQRQLAEQILAAAGKVIWVADEAQLDAVTAVSGSGPAYFFYLMEAMVDAGVSLGLDEETATLLTLETAYGAALMARAGDRAPARLRANVTSPGGTTERALSILEAAGVRRSVEEALTGAAQRSKELAEEFGRS
ncbi:MAG: pyrroline-5-carboxylate reductase [Pseudomonadales bacterium]|nr:pyrroline-5-carboxylate reductase [Pseudomonadales bacterium]